MGGKEQAYTSIPARVVAAISASRSASAFHSLHLAAENGQKDQQNWKRCCLKNSCNLCDKGLVFRKVTSVHSLLNQIYTTDGEDTSMQGKFASQDKKGELNEDSTH
jgi:hypothetical protein